MKGDPTQWYLTLGSWPAVDPEAVRREAGAIRAAAAFGRDLITERRAEAAREEEARRQERLRAVPISELLDGWRGALEAEVESLAREGRSTSYPREMLRLEGKVIRPAIGAETAGGLDPDRLQALINTQPSVSHARNLRNALVRFVRPAFWSAEGRLEVEIFAGLDPDAPPSTRLILGRVDDTELDYARWKVTLTGRDLTTDLLATRTTEKWPNRTAREIAERHGFNPVVTATTRLFGTYYKLEHARLTDDTTERNLLTYLAE